MSLSKKQKDFVANYLTNGYNSTKAYFEAYNCTYETALKNAYKTFNSPEVKAEIRKQQLEHYETLSINAERIAEELANMAFAAKGDAEYTASVKLKALDLLQKQLGLQHQKIEAQAEINNTIEINITE